MRKTETNKKSRQLGLPGALRRLKREESGQTLVMVCVAMLVLLGSCALVVDLARAMDVQRQLQSSADAAALAAAENLPNTDYSTYGNAYTSSSGSKNQYAGLTVGTPTVTGKCLATVTNWGIPCTSSSPYNAVQVTETSQMPTTFAQLLGIKTVTVSATSTASKGRPVPYNIALIVDTTPSMDDSDSTCNGASGGSNSTQLACALAGARTLLQGLNPSMDYVSLFTFPDFPAASAQNAYDCSGQSTTPSSSPNPYVFPPYNATDAETMPYYTYTSHRPSSHGFGFSGGSTTYTQNSPTYETYQVTGFSNDYLTSDTSGTLNSSSDIVKALGGVSNCPSIQTGWEDTYYAAAIYQAQAALEAEQASRSDGSENVIILLSDGNATLVEDNPNSGQFVVVGDDMVTNDTADDGSTTNQDNMTSQYNGATSSGTYPSYEGQCGQGVDAAQYATNQGTVVITVDYGSPTTSSGSQQWKTNTGNCSSDVNAGQHPNISPCTAMQDMASNYTTGNTEYFFSDSTVAGQTNQCKAPDSANNGTLNNIYGLISVTLSDARLIPNSTT